MSERNPIDFGILGTRLNVESPFSGNLVELDSEQAGKVKEMFLPFMAKAAEFLREKGKGDGELEIELLGKDYDPVAGGEIKGQYSNLLVSVSEQKGKRVRSLVYMANDDHMTVTETMVKADGSSVGNVVMRVPFDQKGMSVIYP